MSLATAFFVGLIAGVVIGGIITLAHTEFEPSTNRLFLKRPARRDIVASHPASVMLPNGATTRADYLLKDDE